MSKEHKVFGINAINASNDFSISSTPTACSFHISLSATTATHTLADLANMLIAGQHQKFLNCKSSESRTGEQAQNGWLFTQQDEKRGQKECKLCLYLFSLFYILFYAHLSDNC